VLSPFLSTEFNELRIGNRAEVLQNHSGDIVASLAEKFGAASARILVELELHPFA
jgi:hypothetical protein